MNGKLFVIKYADGTINGFLSVDMVTFAGIAVKSQTFSEITSETKKLTRG